MTNITTILLYGVPAIIFIAITLYVFTLRRIVPTNVVHIVQRGKNTVSYGVGKGHNVYYSFPSWLPVIGVVVRELPVSNFDIDLIKYSAYDKDRVPFVVDVKAFFHIADTNKAAEKVASFDELKKQLENVVQGAVRSILAKTKLEEIMEERAIFGQKFTESVNVDLTQWGVEAIKNIELMDVRDAESSGVIHQIMAKRMSAIDMESRTEIAKNKKIAEQNELEARKEVAITTAETERLSGEARAKSIQAIGIAQAESTKMSGIAQQESISEIAKSEKATSEQQMEVVKIKTLRQAEIDKDAAIIGANRDKETMIINAERDKKQIEISAMADKYKVETEAEAKLSAQNKEAEGKKSVGSAEAEVIKAKGLSEAESKKAMELASVTAQTTLAKEIGKDKDYQAYMIEVKKVEVSQVIGVAQAKSISDALSKAELKLLVNSGDVHSGMGKFSDIFTSKGASQISGLIEGLKQTDEGKAILNLLENFKSKADEKS